MTLNLLSGRKTPRLLSRARFTDKNKVMMMKVICKKDFITGTELREVTTDLVERYDYSSEVDIARKYRVMGLAIHQRSNCLYYLIDDNDRPWWCPYMLFDISDNSLPSNWYIRLIDKNDLFLNIYYLSGFDELCNDHDYYRALIEREAHAVDVYFKRKREYEQEEEYQYLIELGKKGV